MSQTTQSKIPNQDRVKAALTKHGFCSFCPVQQTLQGAIWSACDKTGNTFIAKVTSRLLHEKRTAESRNRTYHDIEENIITEVKILRYLRAQQCPQSVVRYISFFKSRNDYFLIMEKAGTQSLFAFAVKAHNLIKQGKIKICEWRRLVRTIFTQMIEAVEFLHAHNVCHFDISLENFVINDLKIQEVKTLIHHQVQGGGAAAAAQPKKYDTYIEFMLHDLQCKLIDFGLSSLFVADQKDNCVSFKTSKVCGKQFYMAPEMYNINMETGNVCARFDARANDVFGLGVCLFMLSIGNPPWHYPRASDPWFVRMQNGEMPQVLRSWNKEHYVNANWIDLVESMFQYESHRVSLSAIKQHAWLKHET